MSFIHNDVLYRENIRNYLVQRAHAVRVDIDGNLANLAVLSEDFYAEFLNILLDLQLRNANAAERNTKGIDLIDIENRVAVQVSATCSPDSIRKKIRASIRKFDVPEDGTWRFYYLPITDQVPELKKDFTLPEGLLFDRKRNVLDIARIMELAKGIKKLKALSQLVDQYGKEAQDYRDSPNLSEPQNSTLQESPLETRSWEFVFINYFCEQKDSAIQVRDILEANGIPCLTADEIPPTEEDDVSRIINECTGAVVLLSSQAQESSSFIHELKALLLRKKRLYPLLLEKFTLLPSLRSHLGDVQMFYAYNSWEAALEQMVRAIRWQMKTIPVHPSPDTVLRDPIRIKASLPHILEEGYVLFGRYTIQKLLGIYATSQQHYLADDSHTHQPVLVNYIDRTVPYKELYFGISTAGTLFQHPYISTPIDEYSNESYFVHIEPFYTVKSLSKVISENGPQDVRQVKKWAIAVCEAMIYLNDEMGYIYGQMTPVNIRLRDNGLPLLFDVSIAVPIGSGCCFTDSRICAPELLKSFSCTALPAIDVYALGVNMYYALTGNFVSPFERQISYDTIPGSYRKIIRKCLNFNAETRYQHFRAVLSDLEKIR